MIQIPLSAIPNQEFSIVLNNQNCVINIRQNGAHLYLSLISDDTEICNGHICLDREPIPVWATPLFNGKLIFSDAKGRQHPEYSELGDRFGLYYLTGDEWQELTA